VAPELLILDIMMPNRDGFSAAREIREKLPKVPILMVSTRDDEEMIAASKVAGAQGFVSKLDVPVVLLDAVEALLQGQNCFPNGAHPE
jgi:DNA-binding NarL/FixJ family response regulator